MGWGDSDRLIPQPYLLTLILYSIVDNRRYSYFRSSFSSSSSSFFSLANLSCSSSILSKVSYNGSLVEFLLLVIYINAELEIGKSSTNLGRFFLWNDISFYGLPLLCSITNAKQCILSHSLFATVRSHRSNSNSLILIMIRLLLVTHT